MLNHFVKYFDFSFLFLATYLYPTDNKSLPLNHLHILIFYEGLFLNFISHFITVEIFLQFQHCFNYFLILLPYFLSFECHTDLFIQFNHFLFFILSILKRLVIKISLCSFNILLLNFFHFFNLQWSFLH